jgi:hypothetical protein
MAELTRVVPPRSPFNGRWGRLVGVVGVALLVAVIKPWPDSSRPAPATFTWSTPPPAEAGPTPRTLAWDAAILGPDAPPPAWELWAAGRATRVRFVGPPDGFSTPPPVHPAPGGPGPRPSPVIGGPVIELGSADEVTVLGINRPADTDLAAVRLWRFNDGGRPQRIAIRELASPWRGAPFAVFARRAPGLGSGAVPVWEPGLYRLDILIDPVDRIRSLLLVVRPGAGPPPGPPDAPAESPALDLRLLQRLPDAAVIWSFDRILTGWASGLAPADCRVADIWRAVDPGEACHPIPVGRPTAVGVNLPQDRIVTSISIREVDPLPGPVDAAVTTATEGRSGLALVHLPSPGLPDGVYRLDVTTENGGEYRWYIEAGG